MIASKFPSEVVGDGFADIVNTIVRKAPSQKKFRFIERLTVANTVLDVNDPEGVDMLPRSKRLRADFTRPATD